MLLSSAGYVMEHRSALVADLKGHRPKPPTPKQSGLSCRYRRCNLIWDRFPLALLHQRHQTGFAGAAGDLLRRHRVRGAGRAYRVRQGGGLVSGRVLEEGPDMEDSFYQRARSRCHRS
jgi:hypothetical protein